MSYSGYAYGYSPYFQGQDQQQSSTHSTNPQNREDQRNDHRAYYSPYSDPQRPPYTSQSSFDPGQRAGDGDRYSDKTISHDATTRRYGQQTQFPQRIGAQGLRDAHGQSDQYGNEMQTYPHGEAHGGVSGFYNSGQNTHRPLQYPISSGPDSSAYAPTLRETSQASVQSRPAAVQPPVSLSADSTHFSAYNNERPGLQSLPQPSKPSSPQLYQQGSSGQSSHDVLARAQQLSYPSQYSVNYSNHTKQNIGIAKETYLGRQPNASMPFFHPGREQQPGPRLHSSYSPKLSPPEPADLSVSEDTARTKAHPIKQNSQTQVAAPRQFSQTPHEQQTLSRSGTPVRSLESPTATIDPRQVFNNSAHSRKESIAAAAVGGELIQRQSSEVSQGSDVLKESRDEKSSRDRLQAEMKLMIERMREYKSKDPKAFSEVWEQVRKDQGSSKNASSIAQVLKADVQSLSGSDQSPALAARVIGEIERQDSQEVLQKQPQSSEVANPEVPSSIHQAGQITAQNDQQPKGVYHNIGPKPLPTQPEPSSRLSSNQCTKKTSTGRETMTVTKANRTLPRDSENKQMPSKSSRTSKLPKSPKAPEAAMPSKAPVTDEFKQTPQLAQTAKTEGTTSWPLELVSALAVIVERILRVYPANHTKPMSIEAIGRLMRAKPSYADFCASLRALGLVFDSRLLARQLLAGMEYPERLENRTDSSNGSRLENALTTKKAFIASKAATAQPATQLASPNISQTQSGKATASLEKRKHSLEALPRPIDVPVPLTKQDQAKKRTFYDIVNIDLTQDSDEEADSTFTGSIGNRVLLPDDSRPSELTLSTPQADNTQALRSVHMADGPVPTNLDTPNLNASKPVPAQTQLPVAIQSSKKALAQPLNPMHAKHVAFYNHNTIARDFLVSKGEHPYERPLNAHLFELTTRFPSIKMKSDLRTIQWDRIDPPLPKTKPGSIMPAEKHAPSFNKADLSKSTPVTPPELQPSPTYPGFVVANQPSPKAPLSILNRGRGRGRRGRPPRAAMTSSRFETFRYQSPYQASAKGSGLVSPGTNPQPAKPELPAHREPPHIPQELARSGGSTVTKTEMETDETDSQDEMSGVENNNAPPAMIAASADVIDSPSRLFHKSVLNSPKASQAVSVVITSPLGLSAQGTAVKRRGRPPGSGSGTKGKPNAATLDGASDSPTLNLVRRRGRPPGSRNLSTARRPGRKPKGPSQINTSLPRDGIGIMLPSSPALPDVPISYIEEPPPRERKIKGKYDERYADWHPDTNSFLEFLCQWDGCTARGLHNLDTLRKHIYKFHTSRERINAIGFLDCHWNGCGAAQTDGGETHRLRFADESRLNLHIENAHLAEVSKTLGDGPSIDPPDKEISSSYLFDADGRQVTPRIGIDGPPDLLPHGTLPGHIQAYHKAHGNVTPQQKAKAIADSIRAHHNETQRRLQQERQRERYHGQ